MRVCNVLDLVLGGAAAVSGGRFDHVTDPKASTEQPALFSDGSSSVTGPKASTEQPALFSDGSCAEEM